MNIGRRKNEVFNRNRNINRIKWKIVMRATLGRVGTGDNHDRSCLYPPVEKTVLCELLDRVFLSYNNKPPTLLVRPRRSTTRAIKDIHEFFLFHCLVAIASDTGPCFDDISEFHGTAPSRS